jgi:hypothetical protein
MSTKGAPAEPKDLGEAVEVGKDAVAAAKAGLWWYFAALAITVIMFALKRFKVLAKMGRWKYVLVPVMSILAALLAAFQGGVSVAVAIGVLTSGMATSKIQELIEHGILGKPHGEKPG